MRAATDKNVTEAQSSRIRRILDAARHLIEEVGVERMTMRDLAAASGVANATLYNRFGTKDNIIVLAVLDHYEQSIGSGMSRIRTGLSAVDKIVHGLKLFDADIREMRALTHALMGAYFKLDGSREMPNVLYRSAYNTWLPILEEMAREQSLKAWMPLELLCEEICDRQFAVVMKWSQGLIADEQLFRRLKYSVLSSVMVASSETQAAVIDGTLREAVAPGSSKKKAAARVKK